jgi:predicted transcriptional regulator
MAQKRSDVLVRMPAELKRRLVREVEARRGNLNDVAVEILASRFAVPFQGSGRRGGRPSGKGDVLLRMPPELKERLSRRATERGRSVTQLIVETLSESLHDPKRKDTMASKNGSSNGRARSDERVRVAIIGVGNCANSLLQGVQYYQDADPDEFVPGLMHVDLGGYHVRDVEVVAAFDVVKGKVGVDLA